MIKIEIDEDGKLYIPKDIILSMGICFINDIDICMLMPCECSNEDEPKAV